MSPRNTRSIPSSPLAMNSLFSSGTNNDVRAPAAVGRWRMRPNVEPRSSKEPRERTRHVFVDEESQGHDAKRTSSSATSFAA